MDHLLDTADAQAQDDARLAILLDNLEYVDYLDYLDFTADTEYRYALGNIGGNHDE